MGEQAKPQFGANVLIEVLYTLIEASGTSGFCELWFSLYATCLSLCPLVRYSYCYLLAVKIQKVEQMHFSQ